MPYKRVPLTRAVPPAERKVLQHAEAMVADVYTMCSSHPLKRTKAGGCDFSAALVLTCVLDALASHIYGPSRNIQGKVGNKSAQQLRFEKLIVDLMPWHSSWVPGKQDFAEILYIEFRNSLAHEAGRDPANVRARPPGFTEPAVGIWGDVKPQRIGYFDARRAWPEKWPILGPNKMQLSSATGLPTSYRLRVIALYWAVKDIVRQLSR